MELTLGLILKFLMYGSAITLVIFFKLLVEETSEKNGKSFYALIVSICLVVIFVTKQNQQKFLPYLANKIRAVIITTIFSKLATFSQTTMKENDFGKAANLISGDFNIVENYFTEFFSIFAFPFVLLAVFLINLSYMGFTGSLICIVVPGIVMISLMLGVSMSEFVDRYLDQSRNLND